MEAVEELIDRYEASIRMEDPDTLWVKCREDQWKIVLNGERKVTLLHNNYMLIGENQRYIFGGYHNQTPSGNVGMAYAFKLIEGYTWEGHLAAKAECPADGRQGDALDDRTEAGAGDVRDDRSPVEMLWKRMRAWFRAVFKHE